MAEARLSQWLKCCTAYRLRSGPSSSALLSMLTFLTAIAMRASAAQQNASGGNFMLPPLPYAYNALLPVIDEQTMMFHHDRHHANYVKELNSILASNPDKHLMQNSSLSDLVQLVGTGKLGVMADVETQIRNNAGGDWNHAFFWRIMTPPGNPNNTLPNTNSSFGQAVVRDFGSFKDMTSQFTDVACKHFGSGWAWLVYTPTGGKLRILDSLNQDNPLSKTATQDAPLIPILGTDVWEHSYYLKYGPNRTGYLDLWWQVVNWKQVALNYDAAKVGDFDTIIGANANYRY